MKNLEAAKAMYQNQGINLVETQIVKTDSGKYVYQHILNSNSRCETRFYNPSKNMDDFDTNHNKFNYLANMVKLRIISTVGFFVGEEVAKEYERIVNGGKISPLSINTFFRS